jgi:hypothetical protein
MLSGSQNFPSKISLEPEPSSTSPKPVPLSSPPWTLCTNVPDHGQGPFMHRHLPRPKLVTPSTMQAPSPCPWCCSQACYNNVQPMPAMFCSQRCSRACDAVDPCHPRAHSTVVLPEPVTSLNPRRLWARNTIVLPEPARLHSIFFLCHFGPTNPDFDMLHCHIALICYFAFILLHCFDVLHCHIALICSISFNILHWFDMLHCFWYVVLLWDATLPPRFDMLHCHIALICCIVFVLLHCFDVLHCHIALICYIAFGMLHYFDMLHCHIAQWWKWAKWDECGNMDQHYCTIKILALNNKKQIGHSIKLKYESI